MFGVVHIPVVFFAQVDIVVMRHQVGEGTRGLHDALGMLVEQFKKIAFFGQQFAKQHGGSWRIGKFDE